MNHLDIANAYYDAFRNQSDFSEVPLAEDLVFHAPSGKAEGATPFRAMLSGLPKRVKGLKVRHQLTDGDQIVSVYDFDLGAPDGPIPMAERLCIEGGAIAEVELLFDSKRLGG